MDVKLCFVDVNLESFQTVEVFNSRKFYLYRQNIQKTLN